MDPDPVADESSTGAGPGAGEAAGEAAPTTGGGIDWGIDVSAEGNDATAAAPGPIGIDWDIDMQGGGQEAGDASEASPDAAACAAAGGGAGSAAGLSLPDTPDGVAAARLERDVEYRSRLLDDLQELKAFLVQRKLDLGGRGGDVFSAVLPEAVTCVDAGHVAGMLAAAEAALTQLTAPRLRQLLLIATSPSYLDRMAAALTRKAGQEAKMQRAVLDVRARRNEARAQLAVLAPRVAELAAATRTVKARVEAAISVLVGGRRINVLGEINSVLAQAAQQQTTTAA